jgi:hypothetical protein
MSTHEVGISDYFLGEKSSNGEFNFQNGKNWLSNFDKKLEKSNKIRQMLH